jgi:hypothetical protein
MQDAEDAAIVRQVVRVVAAAIFCLLCGNVAGFFVVRDAYDSGARRTPVELVRTTPAG